MTTQEKDDHRNFLMLAKIRDFTVSDVADMSEDQCYWKFVDIRFGDRKNIACPHCGVIDKHYYRAARRQWRCKDCDAYFSCTTGTAFQDRKLRFKKLLLGIVYFVSSAKGVAAMHLSRILKVQVKTAFVMCGKLREALARSADMTPMEGLIEIDGGHFGGRPRSGRIRRRPRPEEIAAKVADSLYQQNSGQRRKAVRTRANILRLKNRRIVLVIRQHSGIEKHGAVRTYAAILTAETAEQVTPVILRQVIQGSHIMTDESNAYVRLSANYEHDTVNHQEEWSTPDGVNENQAESYFSRLRRYVIGISHKCDPRYIAELAWEMAWREDVRRKTEGYKTDALLNAVFKHGRSLVWRGYWQRHKLQPQRAG